MNYRKVTRQLSLTATPQEVFKILHTPSAIHHWWGASRAIVLGEPGGLWCAVWGEDEDAPDYLAAATIKVFDPPRRLLLVDFKYFSRSGPLPFRPEMTTEFTIAESPSGSVLTVIQDRFPADPIADEFYAGCVTGWKNTFESIKKFIDGG